jgi:hypothetical protein
VQAGEGDAQDGVAGLAVLGREQVQHHVAGEGVRWGAEEGGGDVLEGEDLGEEVHHDLGAGRCGVFEGLVGGGAVGVRVAHRQGQLAAGDTGGAGAGGRYRGHVAPPPGWPYPSLPGT